MSDLEMKVSALIRCVPAEEYEKALAEVKGVTAPPPQKLDASAEIRALMLDLGIPAHIKGYRYICTALEMLVEKPELADAITKWLYPDVAKVYDTTWSRVERAIRHAIKVAWTRGGSEVKSQYFGYTIDAERGNPTNSEFLAMAAEIIRQKMK